MTTGADAALLTIRSWKRLPLIRAWARPGLGWPRWRSPPWSASASSPAGRRPAAGVGAGSAIGAVVVGAVVVGALAVGAGVARPVAVGAVERVGNRLGDRDPLRTDRPARTARTRALRPTICSWRCPLGVRRRGRLRRLPDRQRTRRVGDGAGDRPVPGLRDRAHRPQRARLRRARAAERGADQRPLPVPGRSGAARPDHDGGQVGLLAVLAGAAGRQHRQPARLGPGGDRLRRLDQPRAGQLQLLDRAVGRGRRARSPSGSPTPRATRSPCATSPSTRARSSPPAFRCTARAATASPPAAASASATPSSAVAATVRASSSVAPAAGDRSPTEHQRAGGRARQRPRPGRRARAAVADPVRHLLTTRTGCRCARTYGSSPPRAAGVTSAAGRLVGGREVGVMPEFPLTNAYWPAQTSTPLRESTIGSMLARRRRPRSRQDRAHRRRPGRRQAPPVDVSRAPGRRRARRAGAAAALLPR